MISQVDEDRELLLKHARHPSHAGDTRLFAHHGECKNPLCGDAVLVGLDLDRKDRISKIQIQSSGCGISIASASLMTEIVDGLSREQALRKLEVFKEALVASADSAWPADVASLAPLARLRESPTRVPCALIGWFALKDALATA